MGADADEQFLTMCRDDLEERLQPIQSGLGKEPLEFLESILDLEDLRERLV
jgi:hypothetical protein